MSGWRSNGSMASCHDPMGVGYPIKKGNRNEQQRTQVVIRVTQDHLVGRHAFRSPSPGVDVTFDTFRSLNPPPFLLYGRNNQ